MRILYMTRSDSTHDQRFMKALASSGHDGFVLRLYQGDYPTPPGVTPLAWEGLPRGASLRQVQYLRKQLRAILKELQPDLIHAGPIHDVAFLAAREHFQPLLSMSWGFDLMKESHTTLGNRYRTRYTLRHSQGLIVDCQAAAQVATRMGFPQERIYQFPWGVDLEHFSPLSAVVPGKTWRAAQGWQDQTVLLCLRSWEPNYGVDVLAQAFVQAAKKNDKLRLVLLGDGSQSENIRAILQTGGVSHKVHFGGRVPNDRLVTYYGAADVYISPSHVDGSSVSLMEALACGLPAVVSDIPANLEWVRPDENGWIFPDGSDSSLAGLILSLPQKDLRSASLLARQTAVEKADWKRNRQVLLDSYENTFASLKRRPI